MSSGEYVYYEDDFEPKGPSLFRRFISLCLFLIAAHAWICQLLALVICCVVVTYKIYKALKDNDKEKQRDLLCAVVIFNGFFVVEHFLGWLLKFIPLYYEAKLCIFVWLIHPKTRGAAKLYDKFFVPQMAKVEGQIDEQVDQVSSKTTPLLDKAVATVQEKYEKVKAGEGAEGTPDANSYLTKVTEALSQADKYLAEGAPPTSSTTVPPVDSVTKKLQ